MIIKQCNSDNTFGFQHTPNSDVGVDNHGQLAMGYQHHDALWWNRPQAEAKTLKVFDQIFSQLVININTHFRPRQIVELGCGSGQLSYLLRQHDSQLITVTIDANQETVNSPYVHPNHFIARTDQPLDFRDPDDNPIIFDMIITLEHLEHISHDTIDVFMQNIVNHSAIGSKIIATAATFLYPEERNKHVHCNIRSRQQWIQIFSQYGFSVYPTPFPINRGGSGNHELFLTRTK